MSTRIDTQALMAFVRRQSAFEAFADDSLTKRELADTLSVSRPTAYRIINSFEDAQLLQRTSDGYALTPYGKAVGNAVVTYQQDVAAATSLRQWLNDSPADIAVNHQLFTAATVTEATVTDPFLPINRFRALVEDATRVRSFHTLFLEPIYLDHVSDRFGSATTVESIYDPDILELVSEQYPSFIESAQVNDQIALTIHDGLPFPMALTDDRIGVGVCDDRGTLSRWVDTDERDAVAWGEQLFAQYRDEAARIDS